MRSLQRLLCSLGLAAVASAACAEGAANQPGADGYRYTTLASFDKGEAGPRHVVSSLIAHPDGHFYGTSYAGGKHGAGTVFRMDADGTVKVLHNFAGHDGLNPIMSPLVLARDGTLYGTANRGGESDGGVAFKLRPGGRLSVIHAFGGEVTAPREPNSGLVEGTDGHLYGTTDRGGKGDRGTVFRLRRNGEVKVLHAFPVDCATGCFPRGLADGGDGFFYGLTVYGGDEDFGTAYRIDAEGQLTLLHHFRNPEGALPQGPLLRTADGALLGTTSTRGRHGHGTVFELARSGGVSVLAELNRKTGSPAPAPLAEGRDGGLYFAARWNEARTLGMVVRIDRSGALNVVHDFDGREGGHPWAGLVSAADGTLVGATQLTRHKEGRFGTVYGISLPPALAVAGPASASALPAPAPAPAR